MSGSSGAINIPSVFVKFSNAGELAELLSSGTVNITLYDSSGTVPKTDSDLDLAVIAHEYGHGVSNRLTCGPSNTSALSNAEQMGEGWSDYLGLALTVKNGDLGSTPRGIGNWLIGEDETGGGIRTYPYTTNMSINPHTYKNIKLQSVGGKTEVHYLGEVWCVMLWDLHWKMVEKYGYDKNLYNGTGGNNKALRLVMEGMKLQKCFPGFVDGRDAILKADSILNGAANSRLIWEVFARRGLGYSAKQGSSASTSDGTEAFDIHPSFSNGITKTNFDIASIRPNPVSDLLYVEPMNASRIEKIEVLDIQGKSIILKNFTGPSGSVVIDVNKLSPGLYFLNISTGQNSQVLKFQKQ
jgi:extracellular elastinolytic metalloproteinase